VVVVLPILLLWLLLLGVLEDWKAANCFAARFCRVVETQLLSVRRERSLGL
jgi:hypothetical protein